MKKKNWFKAIVVSGVLALVLVAGAGAAFSQAVVTTTTTTIAYPPTTTTLDPDLLSAGAGQSQGLPRTGSSSSIPTAAIAAGMVAVGSVLVVVARRRNATNRS